MLGLAPAVEPERRDPEALLEALLGVGRHRARDEAAEVRVVGDGCHDREQPVAAEDGLDDEDVGQVHAARERVVDHDDVAGLEAAAELAQDGRDGVGQRAELVGQRHALGDDLALRVAEGRREVHRALDGLGVRGADDARPPSPRRSRRAPRGSARGGSRRRRLPRRARGRCHAPASISRLSAASRRSVKSGGTTVVAS